MRLTDEAVRQRAAFQTFLGISTQKAPLTLPELVNRGQL